MSLKREPLRIVEIDIDFCENTYGSSPCTAVLGTDGVRKCYNTYFTCQDRANFDAGTLTLRFAENQSGLPKGQTIFPALRGVSTNPSQINLGGVDDDTEALGRREVVTIDLQDFTYSDAYTDPYRSDRLDGTGQTDEGGYDPAARGTFFGKLRRRFPYYVGRALRVKEGYVGQSLASMRAFHYVISGWSGPNANGQVSIEAKDILDLAENDKALCPAPNNGQLAADIEDNSTTLTLTPEGVGGEEYETSGRAVIGSEVVIFTRSGDDVTLTARGVDGTEASSHSAEDTFQQCYRVENEPIASVIRDLLRDYAGIDAGFIPFSDWSDEAERWLAGFNLTRTITKPTGVQQLVGEILQLGLVLWWDKEDQEVKFRANRPVDFDETPTEINDDNAVIEGSIETEDMHTQRLTRVVVAHGQIDPTRSVDEVENYRRFAISVDPDRAGENQYDQERTMRIYSPWLGSGNDSIARPVAARLLNRYSDTPRRVMFMIDVKDKAAAALGGVIRMRTRVLQDETGNSVSTQMQIISVEELRDVLAVSAETFSFDGRYGQITEDSRDDYDDSTEDERRKGIYIVGPSGVFSDGTGPYKMF